MNGRYMEGMNVFPLSSFEELVPPKCDFTHFILNRCSIIFIHKMKSVHM